MSRDSGKLKNWTSTIIRILHRRRDTEQDDKTGLLALREAPHRCPFASYKSNKNDSSSPGLSFFRCLQNWATLFSLASKFSTK